jgi:hypothetical protein
MGRVTPFRNGMEDDVGIDQTSDQNSYEEQDNDWLPNPPNGL